FEVPAAEFTGTLPSPPIHEELEPVDYFYSMFGKESITLMKNQSNLYSPQMNPNKPLCVSENEMNRFISILLMTDVYSFPQQRFFWMNATRVESLTSAMSRDQFLPIKRNINVVDNTNILDNNDPNFDRAYKVGPLLNIFKENFRKIPKEENECLALYRRHSSGQKIPKKNIMSLLKFRVNVAAALLQCNPSSSPTAKRGRPSLQSIISDQTSPKSSGATPNPLPSKNIRMDRFTH
ncbi:unnamed protein product, partial [Rotaria sp. Silwood2]